MPCRALEAARVFEITEMRSTLPELMSGTEKTKSISNNGPKDKMAPFL